MTLSILELPIIDVQRSVVGYPHHNQFHLIIAQPLRFFYDYKFLRCQRANHSVLLHQNTRCIGFHHRTLTNQNSTFHC